MDNLVGMNVKFRPKKSVTMERAEAIGIGHTGNKLPDNETLTGVIISTVLIEATTKLVVCVPPSKKPVFVDPSDVQELVGVSFAGLHT